MTNTPKYEVVDLHATTASHLRPKSTSINPRYLVRDAVTHEVIDEASTKRVADGIARDLNREVER